jgi:hypothetical protein
LKPPYRRITAIDLNKGDIAWQIPLGDGPRNHPAIKHLNLGPLGARVAKSIWGEGGILVTKTLLITIQADVDELGDASARGSWLMSFDKATGKEIARIKVDRHLHSSPMTATHKRPPIYPRCRWRRIRTRGGPGLWAAAIMGIRALREQFAQVSHFPAPPVYGPEADNTVDRGYTLLAVSRGSLRKLPHL